MTAKLPNPLSIPNSGPVDARIRIPGSKSLSNRAILIAALANGESELSGLLNSDDTKYMIEAWRSLGTTIDVRGDTLRVTGCGGSLRSSDKEIYIENAGTAARFLTATLTLGTGTYVLTGNERMKERPIHDLLSALRQLGAQVKDIRQTGCPPVEILGTGLDGGVVTIPGEKSSQYISAIMLTAPYAKRDIKIQIEGELVSRTYVDMTMKIMREFGAICDWDGDQRVVITSGHPYQAKHYAIEGDASSASYFFGMAAITRGRIKVLGVSPESTQGDLGLVNILEQMGCEAAWDSEGVTIIGRPLKAVTVDMNTMSDVAPTLAVIALFAEGTTEIHNVGNIRIKECDRIQAIVSELRKLGAKVTEWEDGFSVTGGGRYAGTSLETYEDHRMAMSLSMAGLNVPGVTIINPDCVSKTFPDFFDYFLPIIQAE